MVAVGNHELLDLLMPYLERFSMPGNCLVLLDAYVNVILMPGQLKAKESGASYGNLYYSFEYGNVHFIMLDSESFEYFHLSPQYIWYTHASSVSINKDFAFV